jgi:hypothetical protein
MKSTLTQGILGIKFNLRVGESMTLTPTEQKVLDCICIRGGGVDIHEAMNNTELDYKELNQTLYNLISKGYQIRALSAGGHYDPRSRFSGWTQRIYLSPSDKRYGELITH